MPPKQSSPNIVSSLPRGNACRICRQKKRRCDGVKPSCGPCTKSGSPSDCAFDVGRKKTLHQELSEKLLELEHQLEEVASRRVAPSSDSSPHASDVDARMGKATNYDRLSLSDGRGTNNVIPFDLLPTSEKSSPMSWSLSLNSPIPGAPLLNYAYAHAYDGSAGYSQSQMDSYRFR